MLTNAQKIPCSILVNSQDEQYKEKIRLFQGCPTIAVTKRGRIFLGWYSGGIKEPDMDNYNLLQYSDDNGKSWSSPVIIIPSNKEKLIHALDIQLWIGVKGELHVCWVQNNTMIPENEDPKAKPSQPLVCGKDYIFNDFQHAEWEIVCERPDDNELSFSEPRYLHTGFLRCKPLFLRNGTQLHFAYDQLNHKYGYFISEDEGKSFQHYYGPEKMKTFFDEAMAYQRQDGSIRMLARTSCGRLAQTFSYDNGLTWEEAHLSDIVSADTRFFIARMPSGKVILVVNDDPVKRCNMTICISEDDGVTWKYKRCIDSRDNLSYPDIDFHKEQIYLTYDHGRTLDREILFVSFREEDVYNPDYRFQIQVVSKP